MTCKNGNPRDILDTSNPLNLNLFDEIVSLFYSGSSDKSIHDILAEFQQSPNAWTKAPEILQNSSSVESKMVALNVLKICIVQRWKILPLEQKSGIKNFVESLVIKLSQDPNVSSIGPFLTKLNQVLIEIIKREWPHNWPGFIQQVVEVSKRSEIICCNNMKLLRLLSEEAFKKDSIDMTYAAQSNLQKNLDTYVILMS